MAGVSIADCLSGGVHPSTSGDTCAPFFVELDYEFGDMFHDGSRAISRPGTIGRALGIRTEARSRSSTGTGAVLHCRHCGADNTVKLDVVGKLCENCGKAIF